MAEIPTVRVLINLAYCASEDGFKKAIRDGECLACDILNEMFEEERNIINGALMYPDQKNMTEALRVLAQADTRRKIRKLLSSL